MTGNAGGSGGGDGAPPPDPAWDCLEAPPPTLDPLTPQPEAVIYAVPIVDFANPPTPPPMLDVKVCQSNDRDCLSPIPVPITPDPMRPYIVRIPVPYGLEGYLRLEAPGYVPTEYNFGGPMVGSRDRQPVVIGEAIPMLRTTTMDNLYADVSETRQPGTGVLAIRTIDCQGQRAAGVLLDPINPVGFQWTLISNLPRGGSEPTDIRGVAGLGNVEPGVIAVQARMGETAYGRTAIRVKPDEFAVGEVRWDLDTYGR
jgi:hypothetical protein